MSPVPRRRRCRRHRRRFDTSGPRVDASLPLFLNGTLPQSRRKCALVGRVADGRMEWALAALDRHVGRVEPLAVHSQPIVDAECVASSSGLVRGLVQSCREADGTPPS